MRLVCRATATVTATTLALGTMPAAALAIEPLRPLSAWNLDYGETHCVAMRDYGKSQHPVTFAIVPAPNGETYELLVVRKRPGPKYAEELEGSVDFGSGRLKAWLLHYSGTGAKLDLYKYRISAGEMSQARAAKTVTLEIDEGPDAAFELALMPELLDGLDKCVADLKAYWHVGEQIPRPGITSARGDVRPLFSGSDYPSEAMKRNQQGKVRFLLLVDEQGMVAGCHVLASSGVPVLDDQGCALIQKRARFTPARDSNGRPIRDSIVTPEINWVIGK